MSRLSTIIILSALGALLSGCPATNTGRGEGTQAADTLAPGDVIASDAATNTNTCTDSCDQKGQTRCDANGAIETCKDHNADGCIEWGGATPCPGEFACVDGNCSVTCQDECDVAGSKQCGGNAVQTCKDHDADGCLEWGGDVACVGGTVCKSGFCSVDCDAGNECTVQGAKKCEAESVVGCGDFNFDGCLEWSQPTACPPGQTCSNGSCATTCADECTVVGARQCDSAGAYVVCDNHDTDTCLEWGGKKNCAVGEICSGGFCAKECTSECTVSGATKCTGNGVQQCVDDNGDGCLEWGSALPCAGALVCTNGNCALSCKDECTVAGAKTCDGAASVTECGDFDGDGCLEWGTPLACGDGQTCSSGQCSETCVDECTVIGAKKCLGDAIQVCGNGDSDSCLEWGTATPCASNEICSSGFCAIQCQDECTKSGATQCEGKAVKSCSVGSSGCLTWTVPVACSGTQTCSAGICSETCVDECTVSGAKKCEGDAVSQCGDTDSDPCLEWGTPDACGGGQTCSGGFCTAVCSDECTVVGAKTCDGAGTKTCDDYNQDGCLEWGTVVQCGEGQTCSAGNCATDCTDECNPSGAKQCGGNGVQICGNTDADPCLEWGTPEPCGSGLICVSGNCALSCTDECTVVDTVKCAGQTGFVTCADADQDGCLEWGSAVACGQNEVCSSGLCALSCSDECTVDDLQCNAAGTGYQTCADHDQDGCLEWGSDLLCNTNEVCSAGVCAATCTDECASAGVKQCTPNNGTQICGDYNQDGCLQWGTEVACGDVATCQAGECVGQSIPGQVRINELLYDAVGSDKDVFVELWGDPGLALDGFVIVGVNGYDGSDYKQVALTGEIGSDGLFVVASQSATGAIKAAADQVGDVDFQNGPDTVQLRWGATVVDALAYGNTATYAKGEGTPAPDVTNGHSLGRDAQSTDTDDNAQDFTDYAEPTPGAPNGVISANSKPIAVLACPSTGDSTQELSFDASGSSDADGTIVEYVFDWGDGFNASGPLPAGKHAWQNPGSFVVALTVVDNGGASATDSCQVAIADSLAPAVVVLKPAADLQVTQGSLVSGILADVTPSPGRTITAVNLMIDGQVVGAPDDTVPYTFDYTVPTDAVTGSTIQLQVSATDSTGAVGTSPARTLFVKNDVPVASFTAVISGNLEVTADAAGSADTETATSALLVRYDWENDGTWDTSWSTTLKATHTYATSGEYTIALEVKDEVGQIDAISRVINFQSVQDVSGVVTSTLWYGTINVTGDITVPAGETLSIAPGTTVVFLEFDQANDGIGDFDMTVHGTLKIEGTAAAPVIVTTFDTNGVNNSRAWNRITLATDSTNNVIQNAIFEYADVPLDIRAPATLTHVELRNNWRGMTVDGVSAGVTLSDVLIHKNDTTGLYATSSKITATGFTSELNGQDGVALHKGAGSQFSDCAVSNNGRNGFLVDSAGAGIQGCNILGNAEAGVFYLGAASGLLTQSTLRNNGYEGVRASWGATGDPSPSVRYNNIFENGAQGSLVMTSVSLSADSSYSSVSDPTSALWTSPASGQIIAFRASYSENSTSTITGQALNETGKVIHTFKSSVGSKWYEAYSANAKGIMAKVVDNSSYGKGSLTISDVLHTGGPANMQISAMLMSGKVDARYNYFGVWPDVLSAVAYNSASRLDLQGFVGTPFDSSWSVGPYVGGVTLDGDNVWDHDLYITGDVALGQNATLDIAAGVHVTFVPTDQEAGETGDWAIDRAAGILNANGTAAKPVVFDVLGAVPAGGGFRTIHGNGAGASTLTHVVIKDGTDCLRASGGTLNISNSTVQSCRGRALVLTGSAAATVTTSTFTGAGGDSIVMEGTGGSAFDGVTSTLSQGWGVRLTGAKGANTITNSTLTENPSGGVQVDSSTLALSYSNIKFNGYGAFIIGSASGAITASDILYNDAEGVVAARDSSNHPTLKVNGCNIYGNTIARQLGMASVNLQADSSYSSVSDPTSALWSAEAENHILFHRSTYSENSTSSITGKVLNESGATIKSFPSSVGSKWYRIMIPANGIQAKVIDDSSYGKGTLTISDVVYTEPSTLNTEMTVFITAGSFNATGNHWGVKVPTSEQVVEVGTASADYTGFLTSEIAGTGPQ